jgi:steroid 5-alpha reductase family enzyme
MKQSQFIDSHKAVTFIVVLAMIAVNDSWQNVAAWVYLSVHGTYGILWLLKGRLFPDASFQQQCSLGFGVAIWLGLSLYWVAPWIVTSHRVMPPVWYLAMCISMFAMGVFFHFSADMQKHTALRFRPGCLISDGMFSLCRNPNYFGELLIYVSFSLLAVHWLPLVILAVWVGTVWVPRMLRKDRSLSRYQGFASYRNKTKLFIPFVV